MNSKYINNCTFADLAVFVKKSNLVKGDVSCRTEKYIVDGKSLMGLMSIDFTKGFLVSYPKDATLFEEYLNTLTI